jgi:cytochrome bd ubiquinol oxidase subunit I
MMSLLAEIPFIQFPGGAKWSIGFTALFHTSVGSLAIGFAFAVTVLQIVGYRQREAKYDMLAKRVQLWHVCIYNVGTINAIGLVFLLSGLYPQFWSQLFVHFFWTMIVEELLFFLLAVTLTLHYFFWDDLRGHKKMHILMGSLLTPMFFLQFFLINGMGAFMLTPGFAKGGVSQWQGTMGILGWDKLAFYNPSFLMLTLHRTFANFAYGAFMVACICGVWLYKSKRPKMQDLHERGGRAAFNMAFISFLTLPIVGFFYAWVLKYHAKDSYNNLMHGRGDVVAGGIDWWWLKHIVVASMIGIGLAYSRRQARVHKGFKIPMALVYAIAGIYLMFYAGMGMQMTWLFFWASLACAVGAGLWTTHLLNRNNNSGRAVFILMGVLSFATVLLGGYNREASRPRFVSPSGKPQAGANRIAHYDDVYAPNERAAGVTMRMVTSRPANVPEPTLTQIDPDRAGPEDLISDQCIGCHTLQRVHTYPRKDWPRVIRRMQAYGTRITIQQAQAISDHLLSGKPY